MIYVLVLSHRVGNYVILVAKQQAEILVLPLQCVITTMHIILLCVFP